MFAAYILTGVESLFHATSANLASPIPNNFSPASLTNQNISNEIPF
jgi:hypothetical protein